MRLFGDVAIYVAPGSADHRAHPELFRDGLVAGAPPDAFSASGQLWGNPLYDWPALRRRRYRWWVERLRRTLELFELARIDHFRGFVAYWAVPGGRADRAGGPLAARAGTGAVRRARRASSGPLPLVAEDLGVITPPVERLRDELGLPGMLVLQFGFDAARPPQPAPVREPRREPGRLHRHPRPRHDPRLVRVARPGAARRGRRRAPPRAESRARAEPWWGLIRLALASPARLAMIQAQDVLGLGSEARMNDPARAGGSWRWRLEPGR